MDGRELDKKFLEDKQFFLDWGHLIHLIMKAIVVPGLIMTPTVIIWSLAHFPSYNLLLVKPGAKETNIWMEFIRYSILTAAIYHVYALGQVVVGLMAGAGVVVYEAFTGDTCLPMRRQVLYLRDSTRYFAASISLVLISLVASALLYDSSLFEKISTGLNSVKPVTSATASNSGLHEGSFYLERILIFIILLLMLFGISKYILEMIAYHFHMDAFAQRIVNSNNDFSFIRRLHVSLSRGIPKWIELLKESTPGEPRGRIHLLDDGELELDSPQRITYLADSIFDKLMPPEKGLEITACDLEGYFDQKEVKLAFSVLDPHRTGRVDRNDFRQVVTKIYEERQCILLSMESNSRIVGKLSSIFTIVVLVLSTLFGLVLFELNQTAIVVVMGIIYAGLNFALQSSMRVIYEGIHFIFVEHAYDVGDRVIIDGTSMIVNRIDLFLTQFVRWDGSILYLNNSSLAGKTIYNARRSIAPIPTIELTVEAPSGGIRLGAVFMEKLEKSRRDLLHFCHQRQNRRHYSGFVDISVLELQPKDKLKVGFMIQLSCSYQQVAFINTAKKLFEEEAKRILPSNGIKIQ